MQRGIKLIVTIFFLLVSLKCAAQGDTSAYLRFLRNKLADISSLEMTYAQFRYVSNESYKSKEPDTTKGLAHLRYVEADGVHDKFLFLTIHKDTFLMNNGRCWQVYLWKDSLRMCVTANSRIQRYLPGFKVWEDEEKDYSLFSVLKNLENYQLTVDSLNRLVTVVVDDTAKNIYRCYNYWYNEAGIMTNYSLKQRFLPQMNYHTFDSICVNSYKLNSLNRQTLLEEEKEVFWFIDWSYPSFLSKPPATMLNPRYKPEIGEFYHTDALSLLYGEFPLHFDPLKPTIICYWNLSGTSSLLALRELSAIHKQTASFNWVTVNISDTAPAIAEYMKHRDFHFFVCTHLHLKYYPVDSVPLILILNKNDRIAEIITSFTPGSGFQIRESLGQMQE